MSLSVMDVPSLQVGQREQLYHMPAGMYQATKEVLLFVSYQTIVGIKIGDGEPLFTDFWQRSKTTMLHKKKWMDRFGGRVISSESFENIVHQAGYNALFRKAPIQW